MDEYTLLIAIANTATFVTGGAVAALAYRAFRRTGSAALRAVAIGFGFIILGSIGGAIAHFWAGSVGLGVAIQSGFTAGGFAILLYSLYAETSTAATTTTTVRLERSDSDPPFESDPGSVSAEQQSPSAEQGSTSEK